MMMNLNIWIDKEELNETYSLSQPDLSVLLTHFL